MTPRPAGQVLVTRLGGHLFALDAQRVAAIEDGGGPPTEQAVDLARLVGLCSEEPPQTGGKAVSEPQLRRVLRIDGEQGSLRLLAGADVALAALEAAEVQELPPFLAGLSSRACIRGVFSLDGIRLGFLLDADALLQRSLLSSPAESPRPGAGTFRGTPAP